MSRTVELDVPLAAVRLRLLPRVDYEDAYRVDAATSRPAEWWMRAFIQDAPRWFQAPWVGVGVALLGARFGPLRGPDHVLGWRILERQTDLFAVGLDSLGGLNVRLIAVTAPGTAIIATQVELRTAYARALWPAIRRGHRHFAPYLLDRAATHVADPVDQAVS